MHRHIVPHHQPPSSAPAQRRCYTLHSLCTATCQISIVSEEHAEGRRIGAGHEACTDMSRPSTIDRILLHLHGVVRTYSSTLCLATCMGCIVCDGWATGRRFGAGHECLRRTIFPHHQPPFSAPAQRCWCVQQYLVSRDVYDIYRNSCLEAKVTYCKVRAGSAHRRRPQAVHRHTAPHRRPPYNATARRCSYIPDASFTVNRDVYDLYR